jgi:hypothetical protein
MFENHQKLGLYGYARRKKEKKYSTKKKVSGNTKYGKLFFLFKLHKQKFALKPNFVPKPKKRTKKNTSVASKF